MMDLTQMDLSGKSEGVCVFCGIVDGRTECMKVFEDDLCVAFLDDKPLFPGHVLLVPRTHVDSFDDVTETIASRLFSAARLLSKAVQLGLGAEGTFIAVNNRVSQSVPHLHVHVVPRNRGDGLRGFFWPRRKYGDGEAASVQAAIRSALEKLQS